MHSFHHIHNLHITVAPFSRQDLFSRVTWCMIINFAFSNTPTWSPSPSPLSSPWRPLSTWQTQQDGNQNISWGRNSLFSLNNRFGNCFLPQQVYHHSDAGRPISSETIFFSFSFKSWLLWWKCGLVFFAQPLKITNYILPSHCHCRPKIFHSAAQTNCHVNFSKKGSCDENLDKLLTALSGQSWGHVTKTSAGRRSERICSYFLLKN